MRSPKPTFPETAEGKIAKQAYYEHCRGYDAQIKEIATYHERLNHLARAVILLALKDRITTEEQIELDESVSLLEQVKILTIQDVLERNPLLP